MKLTASPFDPTTGELLPVYRDAYLRGDLGRAQAQAVDSYLKRNSDSATETWQRMHEMTLEGDAVTPVGWVQRQLDMIRTEPERFRKRAASLVVGAAMMSGAVLAGTNLPTANQPTEMTPMTEAAAVVAPAAAEASALEATAASAMRMVTVRGRILDENGHPLVGATVLTKGGRNGVSTNAEGSYVLRVPATQTTLVYGYGGYTDEVVALKNHANHTRNVTLVPRDEDGNEVASAKKHRWFIF